MKDFRVQTVDAAYRRLLRRLKQEGTLDEPVLRSVSEAMNKTFQEFHIESVNRRREKERMPQNVTAEQYLDRRLKTA